MFDEKQVSMYCHHLVTAIENRRGQSLYPSVREAFFRVPRHVFVPSYYEGEERRTVPASQDEEQWHQWLKAIYSDEPLVIQRDERGMPTSSSSQPSVMAGMFEALDIQPGHTILEVGTGTGYNAALLATLVGDPHLIITVDIDPTLVESARSRVEQVVGSGMTLEARNGVDGYALQAPYDRIIATGSFFPVPSAWIEQLKPGGKLVMDLHGPMGGGLMVLSKQADGQVSGHFLHEWRHISFMRLRSTLEEAVHPRLRGCQKFPIQEQERLLPDDPAYCCAFHFATFEEFRGEDNAFNTWLQWIFPALSITWKGLVAEVLSAVLTDETTRTVIIIEPHESGLEVMARGECRLWSKVLVAYQDWLVCGKPGHDAYRLCVDQQGRQVMEMECEGNFRAFPLIIA